MAIKRTNEEEIQFLKDRVRNLEGFMSFVEHIFDYHDLHHRVKDCAKCMIKYYNDR